MASMRLLTRRGVLTRLKRDAPLTEIVPAKDIYSQRVPKEPSWPFIRFGAMLTVPFRQSCRRGDIGSFDIHVFAKDREENGQIVETGEDLAERIGEVIHALLHEQNMTLDDGVKARLRLSNVNLMPDRDPQSFHWFAQVNARVLAVAET